AGGTALQVVGPSTFTSGNVTVGQQIVAGSPSALPAGSEPLTSVGGVSGVSMDDRANGSGSRWVVYPNGNLLRFYSAAVNSDVYTFTNGGVATKPGSSTWNVVSDERLKTISGTFTRGLKELMRLEPIRYHYRPGNAMHASADAEHIGFGAQSVQRVIPEAVLKNEKGYLTVDNDPILWTMLNAIKEQEATIRELRAQNAEMRDRLSRVERAVGSGREVAQ